MKTADGMSIELLEDVAAFDTLRKNLASEKHIALDTEFMRTNTFYPLLGLIQLANSHSCYLVDPLPLEDSKSLRGFLSDPGHTLVLHSCSEDLNLLYTALKVIPATVFDTQIAAAFLGLGFSLSYQSLVQSLLGIDIPKDETRSDWLKRPLSDTQKVYAATDVRYLLELRESMEAQLKSKGVFGWFQQDCCDLLAVAPHSELRANWESSYAGINNAWRMNDTGLGYLQKLCVWREQEARQRDKPRSWIAKDGDLLQIAVGLSKKQTPTLPALQSIAGLDKHVINRYGNPIIQLLLSNPGLAPAIDRDLLNKPLSANSRNKLKACQRVVQEIANDWTIAPELLGRKKIVIELVREYELQEAPDWPAAITGWRRELLEPALVPILAAQQ